MPPHISSRLFSTTPPKLHTTASQACAELSTRYPPSKPLSLRKQYLDANQLHLLNITLGRTPPSPDPPPHGTPIPPGHHLVYFTPSIPESDLGPDGTDRTVNPLRPFTRRMWAGGELTWTQDPKARLRIGQHVQETTRLLSAEAKTLKKGGQLLVVGVEKTFSTDDDDDDDDDAGGGPVALVDKRSWVFQEEFTPEKPARGASRPAPIAFPEGRYQRDLCQSETALFRFSALTFNAHKIHYLPEWCREVEGHRGAVVHGPLNLIHMLDLWRDSAKGGDEEALPRSIAYRAMAPLYVGEPYRIILEEDEGKVGESRKWKAEIWDSFGTQSMMAKIVE